MSRKRLYIEASEYEDIRWKIRRNDILKRDGFECKKCGEKSKPLNIHHKYYIKDKKVWEYDNDALITWCKDCHLKWHSKNNLNSGKRRKKIKKEIQKPIVEQIENKETLQDKIEKMIELKFKKLTFY